MNPVLVALRRAFRQPAFVVAFLLLGICAATLNTAAGFMKVHWRKKASPLRISLKQGLPMKMGKWVAVSKDQAIDPEIQQVLETGEYVFRDYVDSSKITDTELELMRNAAVNDREGMLSDLQKRQPASVMRVGVTYYTGLVDTVAHVPERCYVADGYEVKQYEEKEGTFGAYADGTPRQANFRFLGFEDQAGLGLRVERVARNVGYLFNCDGHYTSNPLEVRRQLQNLFEPYGYYAKVEMMTAAPLPVGLYHGVFEANNHDESIKAMDDFLTHALPELEKCLPDWNALHQKPQAGVVGK